MKPSESWTRSSSDRRRKRMADKVEIVIAGLTAGEKYANKVGERVSVDVDEARNLVDGGHATYATKTAEAKAEGK
jgi:hypothetical protein